MTKVLTFRVVYRISNVLPVSDFPFALFFWLLRTACFCSTSIIQSSIWAKTVSSSISALQSFFASSNFSASDALSIFKLLKSIPADTSSGRKGLNKSPSDLWCCWFFELFESDRSAILDGLFRCLCCSRYRIVTSGSELNATIGRFGSWSPDPQLHWNK